MILSVMAVAGMSAISVPATAAEHVHTCVAFRYTVSVAKVTYDGVERLRFVARQVAQDGHALTAVNCPDQDRNLGWGISPIGTEIVGLVDPWTMISELPAVGTYSAGVSGAQNGNLLFGEKTFTWNGSVVVQ